MRHSIHDAVNTCLNCSFFYINHNNGGCGDKGHNPAGENAPAKYCKTKFPGHNAPPQLDPKLYIRPGSKKSAGMRQQQPGCRMVEFTHRLINYLLI